MVGRGLPLLPEILGQSDPVGAKAQIFGRSTSAVTLSEKGLIITNWKSTTSFPVSLRWTSYTSYKPPAQKTENGRFPCKVALRL